MDEQFICNSRYEYIHDINRWQPKVVDSYCVRVLRSSFVKSVIRCISVVVVAVTVASLLPLSPLMFIRDESAFFVWACFFTGAVFLRSLLGKQVDKECVVILPAFGVQQETHYVSGKVIRCFIPINKVLKPVLNECVTPVTCYWSLALIVHGEDKLMLVFKELHPPLKMLVPIWRALCKATESEEA